jgi:hypothetical protein
MSMYGDDAWIRGMQGGMHGVSAPEREHYRALAAMANRSHLGSAAEDKFSFTGRPWRQQEGYGLGLGAFEDDRWSIQRADITPISPREAKLKRAKPLTPEAVDEVQGRRRPAGGPGRGGSTLSRSTMTDMGQEGSDAVVPSYMSDRGSGQAWVNGEPLRSPVGRLGSGPPQYIDAESWEIDRGLPSSRKSIDAGPKALGITRPRGELPMPSDRTQTSRGIAGKARQGIRRDMRTPNAPGATAPWMTPYPGS